MSVYNNPCHFRQRCYQKSLISGHFSAEIKKNWTSMLRFWTKIYWNTLRTCLKISSRSRRLRSSSCLLPLSLASRIRLCGSANLAKAWMHLSFYNLEIYNTRFIQVKSKRKHVFSRKEKTKIKSVNLIRGFPGIELRLCGYVCGWSNALGTFYMEKSCPG